MDIASFLIFCSSFIFGFEFSSARPACSLDPTGHAGVRTERSTPGSRVEYDLSRPIRVKSSFEVEFKTLDTSGLVIFAGGKSYWENQYDAMVVYISNGHLHYMLHCGNGIALYPYNARNVSDGNWHKLHFKRVSGGSRIEMRLDHRVISTHFYIETCEPFSKIYLGGMPQKLPFELSMVKTNMKKSLEACLRNFKVDRKSISDEPFYRAVSTCSEMR